MADMQQIVGIKRALSERFGAFLFALLSCSSANAALVRYDVAFDGSDIGYMIFDAEIGAVEQNLWSSLADWNLGWSGAGFDPSNSSPAADSLFVVDGAGSVINNVEEVLEFPCGTHRCPSLEPTKYPLFAGSGGTSLGFLQSPFLGQGVLLFDDGTGEVIHFGTTTSYSGPTTVPVPAAVWLFGTALLGLGVFKRKIRD